MLNCYFSLRWNNRLSLKINDRKCTLRHPPRLAPVRGVRRTFTSLKRQSGNKWVEDREEGQARREQQNKSQGKWKKGVFKHDWPHLRGTGKISPAFSRRGNISLKGRPLLLCLTDVSNSCAGRQHERGEPQRYQGAARWAFWLLPGDIPHINNDTLRVVAQATAWIMVQSMSAKRDVSLACPSSSWSWQGVQGPNHLTEPTVTHVAAETLQTALQQLLVQIHSWTIKPHQPISNCHLIAVEGVVGGAYWRASLLRNQ